MASIETGKDACGNCTGGGNRVGKKGKEQILKEFFSHAKVVKYLEFGDRHLQICAFENVKQSSKELPGWKRG